MRLTMGQMPVTPSSQREVRHVNGQAGSNQNVTSSLMT